MKFGNNKLLRLVLAIYILILIAACTISCRYYVQNRESAHLASMNNTLIYLANEYENLTGQFWKYYLPIYSEGNDSYRAIHAYFSGEASDPLSPIEKQQLMTALARLTIRTDSVCYVALSSTARATNYVYFVETGRLETIGEDFPLLDALCAPGVHMQVYGFPTDALIEPYEEGFAVAGGSTAALGEGRMLFGFSAQALDAIVEQGKSGFETLRYQIVENGRLIYSSVQSAPEVLPDSRKRQTVSLRDGRRLLVQPLPSSTRQSICYFTVDQGELLRVACRGIGSLIALMLLFVLVTIGLFVLIIALTNREVSIISSGLARIGENHLDYRFQLLFRNDGFNDIASAINQMAERLQRTVEQSYQFELRQRDHEMAELMAKFNPHFLYNTLEVFRSRCMRNGDEETAGLIAHMATIFRNLIGSRHIITIREELAFSQHYLKLFRARYGEQVQIRYDFDSDILDCLIIRNIFQPLIENYFEHGFFGQRTNNTLLLRGERCGEHDVLLTVEDNGSGMTDEALRSLREHIASPETREGESYGLKNLHQRIRLYYGAGYGLTVSRNTNGGLTVAILVAYTRSPDAQPLSHA